MNFKFNIFLYILIFNFLTLLGQDNGCIQKKGGVSFRVDDNSGIYQYRDYANIFNKYGQKFNFAVNLANNEFDNQSYADSLNIFQQMGHLLMDHTPNHATNFFFTKFNPDDYLNLDGIDHVINNKICLSHESPDTNFFINKGYADVGNDTIYFSNNDYNSFNQYEERYFYFPSVEKIVLLKRYINSKKIVLFTDIWEDNLELDQYSSLRYFTFTRNQISITPQALSILANESQKLAQNLYGLTPPTIWIQPGGNFPSLKSSMIKTPLVNLGYTGGATYINDADKVYNEYNPEGDRQFALQWGDFVEGAFSDDKFIEHDNLQLIKNKIADGYAKHQVLINNIHFSTVNSTEWSKFLTKMDTLLSWLTANSIPVKTYDIWVDLLYNQIPDPYENIIPPLNVDLDSNGIPDGYTNILYPSNDLTGVLITDSTAIDSTAFYSLYVDDYKQITHILDLGGIEKGENEFSIYTKGSPGNSIKVQFSAPWPGKFSKSFEFPANTPNWKKYDLTQSINENKNLFIPDTLSRVSIDIYHHSTNTDPIWISGMNLRKKIEPGKFNFTLLNSSSIKAGDTAYIEVELIDEFDSPYVTSYEYNVILPDTSSTELLSQGNLFFNSSSKDTIAVSDTISGFINLTAELTANSAITSSFDLEIFPKDPNVLEILSKSDEQEIGSIKIIRALLSDIYFNNIPDSVITFKLLNGNGKFSNNLNTISVTTDSFGIGETIYTTSTSLSPGLDSIEVSYGSSLFDTLFISLLPAPISNFEFLPITNQPAIAGDSIQIEITAKDIFSNDVITNSSFSLSANSESIVFLPTNNYYFNNVAKDTIIILETVAGNYKIYAEHSTLNSVIDSQIISVVHSVPDKFELLSSLENSIVGSEIEIQIALADSFDNRIADSLLEFRAINGNGRFNDNNQTITIITDTLGIASVQYSTSTNLGIDSLEISYNSLISDTLEIPLSPGPLTQIVLKTLSPLPAYDNDTVWIEASIKDTYNNLIDYTGNSYTSITGSTSAEFISTDIFSFNNAPKDTIGIKDSLAGDFKFVTTLESNHLIADTNTIEVIYSPKNVNLKVMLEGALDETNYTMRTDLTDKIPLISPYIEALDTLSIIPANTVDWILVSLRKYLNNNSPSPETVIDEFQKSALITTNGDIISTNLDNNLGFVVPKGYYYIILNHRNHLPVMSSTPIQLK
jgi:hypothetical protein